MPKTATNEQKWAQWLSCWATSGFTFKNVQLCGVTSAKFSLVDSQKVNALYENPAVLWLLQQTVFANFSPHHFSYMALSSREVAPPAWQCLHLVSDTSTVTMHWGDMESHSHVRLRTLTADFLPADEKMLSLFLHNLPTEKQMYMRSRSYLIFFLITSFSGVAEEPPLNKHGHKYYHI